MSNVVPILAVSPDPIDRLLARPNGEHLVQFYEDDESLFDTLEQFLGAGLASGEPILVIATEDHRTRLVRRLRKSNVEAAIGAGRVVLLDARETLARFLVNGMPDADRFHRVIDDLMAQMTRDQPARVRAFGEMVDLLWRDGARTAAIRLEELWNEAARVHRFSLLCAYVMANFVKGAEGAGSPHLATVCELHSHVLTAPSGGALERTVEPILELDRLRDRCRSLEAENERLKEIEEALRQSLAERLHASESRFRLLVENVEDYVIYMLDPNGVVVTWNAGAARIKGYSAAEIVGAHFSKFYSQEDVIAGKCEHRLAMAMATGRYEDEGWRLRKDGSRFWASGAMTALRDDAGTLIGYGEVTRDLSERVRAEAERVQLARIEEAQRRKDEFLAIMGHELRNPLAPLVTAAHMIRLRGGRATEAEMGVLDRQLRQMTRIVDDLLDASRAMRDRVQLSLETIEIGKVLANALDLAAPLIEERRQELFVDVPQHGHLVRVDPERMAQVFGNVLNNAAKYTPSGGMIKLGAERRGDDIEVIIQDNGQGIAAEMLERVFDLFAQADPGLARTAGGLGIGLAVARRIVREHQGEIVAQSDGLGHGCRFVVRLPAVAAALACTPAGREAPATPSVKRRVLVADDNVDFVEMFKAVVEDWGHEVRAAHDGPQALRVCEEFEPEMVFLDIGLPGMDGYDVAQRMRTMAFGEKMRIVAVSGYTRETDRKRASSSGFSDYFAKPLDLSDIEKLLQPDAESAP
jgi:PAS domain S-box-containing protein